jgi:hypothetical protein
LTQNTLLIEDQISGKFRGAEARFHLHPAVQIEETITDGDGKRMVTLRLPHGQRVHVTFEGGLVKHESISWHPEFGQSVPTTCLVNEFSGAIVRARIAWSDTS